MCLGPPSHILTIRLNCIVTITQLIRTLTIPYADIITTIDTDKGIFFNLYNYNEGSNVNSKITIMQRNRDS